MAIEAHPPELTHAKLGFIDAWAGLGQSPTIERAVPEIYKNKRTIRPMIKGEEISDP
jgi:hypothetical protein